MWTNNTSAQSDKMRTWQQRWNICIVHLQPKHVLTRRGRQNDITSAIIPPASIFEKYNLPEDMHYCNVRLQVIEFPAPHGWYPFSGRLFGGSLHMYLYQKSLNNCGWLWLSRSSFYCSGFSSISVSSCSWAWFPDSQAHVLSLQRQYIYSESSFWVW